MKPSLEVRTMSDAVQLQMRPIREPKTVVDRIVEWLRGELVEGRLRPGDRLPPEDVVARSLGVGRTSVREALKVLGALGVVTVARGQGTRIAEGPGDKLVAPLSFGLILQESTGNDLLQMRRILELGSAEYVVQGASNEDIARIRQLAARFSELVANGASVEELTRADVSFHKAVLEASGNPLLAMVGGTIVELFFVSMRERLGESTVPELAARHHTMLAEALAARDVEAFRKITEESVATWSQGLRSSGRSAR